MLNDDDLASAIECDFESIASLSERRMAMLSYARKLSRSPQEMEPADVESLRAVGFTDLDILHIAEVTAYYAYVNRLADGLGVALEE